jgi:hypothetical protein
VKAFEETWPQGTLYARALRYRLSMRHWYDDAEVQKDADTWLAQSGIKFAELAVIDSVDPISRSRFDSWAVEIAIAMTLLHQTAGMKHEALESLQAALSAAAHTGLWRIFLDECDPLQALLEALRPRLRDPSIVEYTDRLLRAFSCGQAKAETEPDRGAGSSGCGMAAEIRRLSAAQNR